MRSSGIHLRPISQEIPQPSITEIIWKIKDLKFHSNFPGANELKNWIWHYFFQAINGHDQVAVALLKHGADVTIVDDSGLTPVDVAKTKKVKVTLKQAWTEATQCQARRNLGPVRDSALRRSSESPLPVKKGQVMFDVSINNVTVLVLRLEYCGRTKYIPWLLMPWLLMSPDHQQPFLSSLRRKLKNLQEFSVADYHINKWTNISPVQFSILKGQVVV